jgi:lysophospholipase L1-like esterase
VLVSIVAGLSMMVPACGGESSAEPVTIVPIGDSLTERVDASTYRCYLDEMLTVAGVEFDFVGALTQPASAYTCPTEFDRDHEAVNGATIDDRAGPALESVELLQPDVALITLGANDVIGGQPPTEVADELASFIQDLQVAQPDMTILVAQYTPCGYSSAWCQEGFPALHDAIEPMADLSTARSTVIVVDMFTDFSLDDLADAAHPNDSGDEEMAGRWMAALTDSGVVEAASGNN